MTAPPYCLVFTAEASAIIDDLQSSKAYTVKCKKVRKTLQQLRDAGPGYPALQSHRYSSLQGPHGEDVWESYVENHTPGAWRIWWYYGPEVDTLTILTIGKHPE